MRLASCRDSADKARVAGALRSGGAAEAGALCMARNTSCGVSALIKICSGRRTRNVRSTRSNNSTRPRLSNPRSRSSELSNDTERVFALWGRSSASSCRIVLSNAAAVASEGVTCSWSVGSTGIVNSSSPHRIGVLVANRRRLDSPLNKEIITVLRMNLNAAPDSGRCSKSGIRV